MHCIYIIYRRSFRFISCLVSLLGDVWAKISRSLPAWHLSLHVGGDEALQELGVRLEDQGEVMHLANT